MPRYYFHVDGDDDEGAELPNDAAAREQARETFGEMIRDGAMARRMEVVTRQGDASSV